MMLAHIYQKTLNSVLFDQELLVRLEVSMAVTMKNVVIWDVMSCGSFKNRRFGGTYRLHHQGDNNR
jgi:hypothetical protein